MPIIKNTTRADRQARRNDSDMNNLSDLQRIKRLAVSIGMAEISDILWRLADGMQQRIEAV